LMFEKLSHLTKIHVHDPVSKHTNKQKFKAQRQKNNRLSLPSTVMTYLIQNPSFIQILDNKHIDWDSLDFEGIDKFKAILSTISRYKPINQGQLMEIYRGHEDEAIVKKMASFDLLIPDAALEIEFSDALEKLLKLARSSRLDKLLAKEKTLGLDQVDRELLRQLLANK